VATSDSGAYSSQGLSGPLYISAKRIVLARGRKLTEADRSHKARLQGGALVFQAFFHLFSSQRCVFEAVISMRFPALFLTLSVAINSHHALRAR